MVKSVEMTAPTRAATKLATPSSPTAVNTTANAAPMPLASKLAPTTNRMASTISHRMAPPWGAVSAQLRRSAKALTG